MGRDLGPEAVRVCSQPSSTPLSVRIRRLSVSALLLVRPQQRSSLFLAHRACQHALLGPRSAAQLAPRAAARGGSTRGAGVGLKGIRSHFPVTGSAIIRVFRTTKGALILNVFLCSSRLLRGEIVEGVPRVRVSARNTPRSVVHGLPVSQLR